MQIRPKSAVITAVAMIGAAGAVTLGSGVFANAASTSTYTPDVVGCVGGLVTPPATPLAVKKFTVGSGKVSGTIPALDATTLAALSAAGYSPKLVAVTVTTSYNSGRSGAGKVGTVTVTLPGHLYNNPLLFNIPPVVVGETVGTGAVNYSVVTNGAAYANVTVTETLVQAASTFPVAYTGRTCPTGTTQQNSVQGALTPIPTPSATTTGTATATPTASTSSSASPTASASSTGTPTSSASTSLIPLTNK